MNLMYLKQRIFNKFKLFLNEWVLFNVRQDQFLQLFCKIIDKEKGMFNNFMNYEYQPYHKIYTNENSRYSIYLGDVSSALDLDFIKNQPINYVITAALGMDQVSYTNGQVKHIVYPLLDAKSQNISKFFNQFFQLIDKQIHNGNILVHCAAGISRSATLVISYFMKKNNWSFKEAIRFVRDKRPIILPNLGFQRQLKQFQIILSRQSHTAQVQKRFLPTTNQSRKNLFSPLKNEILPDIKNLGQTSFIKSKILQRHNINIKFQPDSLRDFAHRRVQIRNRKSDHQYKGIKKKGTHSNNFNKQLIFAKIQSGRTKLLQRSNNFINMNFANDISAFGDEPLTNSKKLSSLSHRSEKVSQDRKLRRNYSNNKQQKNSNLFQDINKVLVSKLHLNQRKFATQKQLRTRGLNRLAQL